jgi:non-specific serine/threonine protein kinase
VEVTTYVGRQNEILEARRLLGTSSLVSLIGPGGVGKTRLALRVAAGARASFGDDVVFVSLAELREPELLVNTVADRLGLGDRSARRRIDLLVDQLRDRRLLLVLDNCEHLVEACAWFVDTLLTSCPDLVVLATSRQSLGVEGERVLPVPPLTVPEPGQSPHELGQYDAVRMFIDRAAAVVPSFAITDDNVEDVIRLCRALDGLPLAIELAAVRLRSLSVRQLADRLNKRFTLLIGGRRRGPSHHLTFQALIDWSYELCTDAERLLWARASVFSGSFDLDAAEQVCSGDGLDRASVLDVIDGLIDKSILLREEDQGVARYRMLETMRQYGEDKSRESGDLARMRRRHRDWCLELTTRFEAEWFGPDQVVWLNRLRLEHANFRGAMEFCTSDADEAVIGLRLADNIKEFWIQGGLSTEGRIWLTRLLDAAPLDAPDRAAALWIYAFLALLQGDMPAYESALAQAALAAEATGDDKARAFVNHVRAYAALMGDRGAESTRLFDAATETFRAQGDRASELWSTYNYGLAVALAGDLDRAREVLRDCTEQYVAQGEVFWRSWALWSRGAAEYLYGDMTAATDAVLEVLRLQQSVGDRTVTAFALTVAAGCATHSGQSRRAARLLGAANTVWKSIGSEPMSYVAFVEPMKRDVELVTGDIGVEAAGAEFLVGAALSTDDALSYALGEELATESAVAAEPTEASPLTRREAEIAELVAQGMTNREIADRLVIARRTAETHVDHIMTKLGFTSRAQIAAWFVESRRA